MRSVTPYVILVFIINMIVWAFLFYLVTTAFPVDFNLNRALVVGFIGPLFKAIVKLNIN